MKNWTAQQQEAIKAEIKNIHDRGKGDYETLIRQVADHHRCIELNEFQAYVAVSRAKYLISVVGRGGGKTCSRGERWSRILDEMPRSTGLFITPSYQAALTRILPSLKQGLELFGVYENLHYFIGRQPPRSWRKSWGRAYQSPDRYDRYISFWNGVGVHLISHDLPNDGKGLNTDWADGDEAALLDPAKLQENTDPTIRGTNKKEFSGSALFGSRFYTSSMPLTQKGMWLLDYEQKCYQDPVKYHYLDFPCMVNSHNLIDGFLEEARANAIYPWMFDAEYMNIKPKFTKDGFYPLLDEDKHTYNNFDYSHYVKVGQVVDCRGDADVAKDKPLILNMDWGAVINCLVVTQHLRKELRALKAMYVLGDLKQVQSDLIKKFHEYYKYHPTKEIYMWYDSSGNVKDGRLKVTRAQEARKQLQALGWKVRLMTIGGRNPLHGDKHVLWNHILKEEDHSLPRFRMNKANCKNLWISMFNAKAKEGSNGEIRKDKSSERSNSINRQHATDFSDAIDAGAYGMFHRLLQVGGYSLPSSSTASK